MHQQPDEVQDEACKKNKGMRGIANIRIALYNLQITHTDFISFYLYSNHMS